MPKNPPDGYQRVIPYLHYNDAPAAITFLVEAFGFTERMRLPMPDGSIGHAELSIDENNLVMLSSEFPEMGYASPKNLAKLHSSVMVYVDDVDAHHATAVAAGATVLRELQDQFYGDRTYTVADIEGHHWTFGTHIKDIPLDELKVPEC